MFGEKIVISDPLLYQGTLLENRICCRCTSGQVEDEIHLEHGKGSELLDNQQRASRDGAKKNIFFLMLNASHPVCRSPIPFNQIVVDKRY
jgi:hypothetical protein